ncbi:DUF2855 family protein [Lentzea flaviverrucosa]|uniref:DUF2855 domain-containing protein n=1 Tax=Lentzea flaviverrucosa TaxID=200379 RepID=A0A1H9WQ14_9PSEU|nr:DUF2855 family protein [Lentzea flaviverrucosa]RDI22992.1 uncharacterized protein DUF2855 [Lentzea flaviverrucosa]SES36036.1 Protein of unknown function [Lentzea flaviverrucosa]
MIRRWTVVVDRDDLTETEVLHDELPESSDLSDCEVLLRVSHVGLTANNVTYGVIGDVIGYWNFFPAGGPCQGVIPLWGFADVVDSTVDALPAGTRVYGYLPMASHLVVRAKLTSAGFVDTSDHRAELPAVYNSYLVTDRDPAYDERLEDLQVLYRPLFLTSFLLADRLVDNDFHGARTVVISSASSKTAFGTAHCLKDKGVRLVGLTSPRNVEFTKSLGLYDTVLPYGASVDVEPSVYLDFSGSADVRSALHDRLGSGLVKDVSIGLTHQAAAQDARSEFFFAPDQLRKRTTDWGSDGLAQRFGEAWRGFTAQAGDRVAVVRHSGPEELVDVWQAVLAGKANPNTADVISF